MINLKFSAHIYAHFGYIYIFIYIYKADLSESVSDPSVITQPASTLYYFSIYIIYKKSQLSITCLELKCDPLFLMKCSARSRTNGFMVTFPLNKLQLYIMGVIFDQSK